MEGEQYPELDDEVVVVDYRPDNSQEVITSFKKLDKDELRVEVTKVSTRSEYFIKECDCFSLKIIVKSNGKSLHEERSSHDLEWLSDTIKIKYPGIGIPVWKLTVKHDAQKQKCFAVEHFLNYILDHPVLTDCPEIASFLHDGPTYLSFKKEQEAQFEQESAKKGTNSLGLNKLRYLIKKVLDVTKTIDKESIDRMERDYNIRDLMKYESAIMATCNKIDSLIVYRENCLILNTQIFKNQHDLMASGLDCLFLRDNIDKIKTLFREASDNHRKETIEDHINIGLPMQFVSSSLALYLTVFEQIRQTYRLIQDLKSIMNFQEMHEQQVYLRLLTNNMRKDIKVWLDANNQLLDAAAI